MHNILLRARDLFDPVTDGQMHVTIIHKTTTRPHTHDFYEIFLILAGAVEHCVNRRAENLTEGTLVFMRPPDGHYFEPVQDDACELVNLAFPRRTFERIRRFLGDGFPAEILERPVTPPSFKLSPAESGDLGQRILRIGRFGVGDSAGARAHLRTLLAELYLEFFVQTHRRLERTTPAWIARLCAEMKAPRHFTRGLPALRDLAHKSPEHLCRSFRKHLGRTPTEFVNDLRLDYAARLLVENDDKIVAVALEVGFENLSHFYHEFRRRFGRSPADYRRHVRRTEAT